MIVDWGKYKTRKYYVTYNIKLKNTNDNIFIIPQHNILYQRVGQNIVSGT